MTARWLVVCEAPADFRVASELADRVLCDRVSWLDESLLATVRQWRELAPDRPFIRWMELDRVAQEHGLRLRPRSRFAGEPGAADAAAADKALILAMFLAREGPIEAVLLIRDSDGYAERGRGLEQARSHGTGSPWPFEIVIGLAHPKREAWALAGFEPQDATEQARLESLRQTLKLDPCAEPERLNDRSKGSARDIKRVLDVLTAEDFAREAHCWQHTPLERLIERGHANGLTRYLHEIETRLVPLLSS